jgi:hypothetical protein
MLRRIILGTLICCAVTTASARAADPPPAELETMRQAFAAAIGKQDVSAVAAMTNFPLAFSGYEHPDKVLEAEFADEFEGLFFGGSPQLVNCLATGKLEPAQADFPDSPWAIYCDGNDYYFGERGGKWLFTAYQNTNE